MKRLILVLLLAVLVTADLTPSEVARNAELAATQTALSVDPLEGVEASSPSLEATSPSIPTKRHAATSTEKRTAATITEKSDLEVITAIADGGTNSGTTLTNGKLMYSASSAIVEAPYLKSSDGKSITISDSGATSVSPTAAVKLNLIGVDSSLASGPHISTYTSADNYPLKQDLSFAHDNIAISFDSYWDATAWKSSYSGSNFQIYKQYNQLQFNYASGVAAGSGVTFSNAFYIASTGATVFTQPIRLPTSGGTASNLDYYTDQSISCAVAVSAGSYTVSSVTVRVSRIGTKVTYTIPKFSGTLSTTNAYITIAPTYLPSSLLPSSSALWPIAVSDSAEAIGFLEWDTTTFRLRNSNFGVFTTGAARGVPGDFSFSFMK